MKKAVWILSAILAGCIALMVWMYVSDRAAAAEWALKDAERVQQRDTAIAEARAAQEASAASLQEARDAQTERDEVAAELAELRKKRRTQPMPTSLRGCLDQLSEAEGEIDMHVRNAGLDAVTIVGLEGALAHQTRRGDILQAVVTDEIDRADGWREYARKSKRRDRIKLAFVGIGSAVGGGLVGYGVGVTR